MRNYEPAINCLNSTGLPNPLNRLQRVPKHDTTQIIPSDGFNEAKTTVQADFVNPKTHSIQEKPILKMIHRYNLADLNLANRSAKEPFDKTFNVRSELQDNNDWKTTYHGAFGQFGELDAPGETFKFKKQLDTQAGVSLARPFEN